MATAERADLSIGDLAEATGVAAATLRMWETRHGFPTPERLPGGHRRYTARDAALVREVSRQREAGLSVEAAVERALRTALEPERSIYSGLRRRRPGLAAHILPKRILLALSQAIEDEYCARADHALLFGSFQGEGFYRQAERRWRELARTADLAVAFADFSRLRSRPGRPIEVPVDRDAPLAREWSVVCDASLYSACLSAWELPGHTATDDSERLFETVWSIDPRVVRDAARVAADLAARSAPGLSRELGARLEEDPPPPGPEEVALLSELTSRMVAYVSSQRSGSSPTT